MILGIVGSEAAKFTSETEEIARLQIRAQFEMYPYIEYVISGACHLGGIDIWAIDEAKKKGLKILEFPPKKLQWEGGYKQRNIKIAELSDKVVCITLKQLPGSYKGMRFSKCYHCNTNSHVKSGGCWTMKYAFKLGKETELIVI